MDQHPSSQQLDVDWLYAQLDEEQREQFESELRAAYVHPDEIATDPTCTPDAEPAVIGVAKRFVDVLRNWQLSVVLGADAEWQNQKAESDEQWTAAVVRGEVTQMDAASV